MDTQQDTEMVEARLRSPKERRNALRDVLATSYELQGNTNKSTIFQVESLMEQADKVAKETTVDERVNHQEEIVLDARVLNSSSIIIKECSQSITKEISNYEPDECATKIRVYVQSLSDGSGVSEPHWNVLERKVAQFFNIMPKYSVLLGTLEPIPKKDVARRQTQQGKTVLVKDPKTGEMVTQVVKTPRQQAGPKKMVQAVVQQEKEEVSVEESVEKIRKIIVNYHKERNKALDYFRLIINPDDFGRTVENMLHVSFLIKDNLVKMFIGDNGALVVEPLTKEVAKQAKKSKDQNVQNVISITQEQWRHLKRAYRIQKPMIDFYLKVNK